MKRRDWQSSLVGFVVGSPLLVLVATALFALVVSTPIDLVVQKLREQDTWEALCLSLRTTVLSTFIVGVLGLFLAYGVSRCRPLFATVWETVLTLPAVMPPSVIGLSLLLAFGRRGVLGPWLEAQGVTLAFTTAAVVVSQVFVSCPFFFREALSAFRSMRPDLMEAAKLDGATTWMTVRKVSLPLAAPFVIAGLGLAWARALGEFGATILFAGNLKGVTQTMPLAVYVGFESDMDQAKALAIVLLVTAVVVMVATRIVLGRRMSFAH
ncbi:MAG: molybdate ABC transporter permease subunit [Chthonomonadaceae bacterium]|nr:molybdate ABC transporter permease subunit [Chthonomonadaceae bacterium]